MNKLNINMVSKKQKKQKRNANNLFWQTGCHHLMCLLNLTGWLFSIMLQTHKQSELYISWSIFRLPIQMHPGASALENTAARSKQTLVWQVCDVHKQLQHLIWQIRALRKRRGVVGSWCMLVKTSIKHESPEWKGKCRLQRCLASQTLCEV